MEDNTETTPVSTIEAVRRFAEPYDPEPTHSAQVTWIALTLFDQLRAVHGLSEDARLLLEVAGHLHDIGYARDPNSHHKRARDMILESNLVPFSERELRIIACLARYHRGSGPQPDHKVYMDLSKGDRELVRKLAAVLRIADGLDRAHISATRRVTASRAGDTITLLVEQRQASPVDIEGAAKKQSLFEEVYRISLQIIAVKADGPPPSSQGER